MRTSTRWSRSTALGVSRTLGGLAGLYFLSAGACSPGQDGDPPITVTRPNAPGNEDPDDGAAPPPFVGAPTPEDQALVEAPPPPFCGDGALNDDEQCDDGNTVAADGCSANCLVVEQGYTCALPGAECTPAELCGDGFQIGNEQCDDGNVTGADGCAANCQLERDYVCPTPGQPCVSSVICGDGLIRGDEQCDDGNLLADDGCSTTCQLETGWTCPIPGARCVGTCGDGILRGLEQCDDLGTVADDGCNQSCGTEDGFVCRAPGEACAQTVCGDERAEGSEGCDDPNDTPFDGCFQCVREPECVLGECVAVCGDGLRFDTEDCDDGNELDGDGCSALCKIEPGFSCLDQGGDDANGDTFVLPVIYRDFIGVDTSGDGLGGTRATARQAANVQQHPDFNSFTGTGVLGAVAAELDDDGKPVLRAAQGNFTSAARFAEWYRDTPNVNLPIVDSLTLTADPAAPGSFVFDSLAESVDGQFDPILGRGWQDLQVVGTRAPTRYEGQEFCDGANVPIPDAPTTAGATARNMSFTTETRFVFEYQGGETFAFSGDDDVWVFVNNRLVMDLGGLHEIANGDFTLSAGNQVPGIATVTRTGPAGSALTLVGTDTIDTGMEYGGVYEAVLFHAERHECGSNFKLTLAGFDKPKSACQEVCGDSVVTRSETCDEGELNGSGYGACAADCTPGPRCGDGAVNGGGEVCDNGLNVDRYSRSSDACGPGCTQPSFCGDKVVDSTFDEQCDDGVNDNSYGGCTDACKLGPRCGDGVPNGTEECDDGNRINGDGCNLECKTERDVIPT